MARSSRITVLVGCGLLVLGLATSPSLLAGGSPPPPQQIRVTLAPNPIHVGQTLTVTVHGARPGGRYGFLMVWHRSVHGIVIDFGRYTADSHGVIQFRPVTFTLRAQSGWYTVKAFKAHGRRVTLVATVRLRAEP
jgi:hypothetical protein